MMLEEHLSVMKEMMIKRGVRKEEFLDMFKQFVKEYDVYVERAVDSSWANEAHAREMAEQDRLRVEVMAKYRIAKTRSGEYIVQHKILGLFWKSFIVTAGFPPYSNYPTPFDTEWAAEQALNHKLNLLAKPRLKIIKEYT